MEAVLSLFGLGRVISNQECQPILGSIYIKTFSRIVASIVVDVPPFSNPFTEKHFQTNKCPTAIMAAKRVQRGLGIWWF